MGSDKHAPLAHIYHLSVDFFCVSQDKQPKSGFQGGFNLGFRV